MSRVPGPIQCDPFSDSAPARTPGSLGIRDAGDPNCPSFIGDTPESLGRNDAAQYLATGLPGIASSALGILRSLTLAATPGKPSLHRPLSSLVYS